MYGYCYYIFFGKVIEKEFDDNNQKTVYGKNIGTSRSKYRDRLKNIERTRTISKEQFEV